MISALVIFHFGVAWEDKKNNLRKCVLNLQDSLYLTQKLASECELSKTKPLIFATIPSLIDTNLQTHFLFFFFSYSPFPKLRIDCVPKISLKSFVLSLEHIWSW